MAIPRATDGDKLLSLLEETLDKTTEIVLIPSSVDSPWVLNLKCPFMRDFVDPELRATARRGMLQYAISK